MSGLKAFESIRGTISGESTLSGTLSVATGQDTTSIPESMR